MPFVCLYVLVYKIFRSNSRESKETSSALFKSKSRKTDRVNKLRNLLNSSCLMTPTSSSGSGALSMFLSSVNKSPAILQKEFKKF